MIAPFLDRLPMTEPAITEPVRLAKRLAEMLSCSRREAELYIAGGWVSVDGQIVEEPQFKVAQQKIELDPQATLAPLEPATILFHQPAGLDGAAAAQQGIRAETRWPDDPTGIRLLKHHLAKLTATLPLEAGAGGLLVFTQDWRVARKLLDDAATVEQEYIVEFSGELTATALKSLNHGQSFNGRALPPSKVSRQSENRLRFALKNPQPGQIAHLCLSAGLTVQGMKRIRLGRVAMAKLAVGTWRYLGMGERF